MQKKLRVLQVYRTYFPDTQGGAEEVVRQISLATASHGIETRIFVPSPNPSKLPIQIGDTEVIQVKLNFEIASCGFCLTGIREFARQVAWADLVHFHFPWPFGDILNLMIPAGMPRLVTYHSDIVRQASAMWVYSPLMHKFLASMDAIVATSPNYLQTSAVLQQYSERVEIIPIGINETSYPSLCESNVADMRAQYGEQFFLFVGMLRYYKNVDVLLRAAQGADFKVVIAGSGPLDADLKALAISLGLDNVSFAGRVSDEDKMALIELSRGVVLPSQLRSEAFGVSLLEGAMRGKPLVSIEIGTGTTYVNTDGETGFAADKNSHISLRAALQSLAVDNQQAERLGKNARKRFDEYFTADLMGHKYAALYKRLCPEPVSCG